MSNDNKNTELLISRNYLILYWMFSNHIFLHFIIHIYIYIPICGYRSVFSILKWGEGICIPRVIGVKFFILIENPLKKKGKQDMGGIWHPSPVSTPLHGHIATVQYIILMKPFKYLLLTHRSQSGCLWCIVIFTIYECPFQLYTPIQNGYILDKCVRY